MKPTSILLKSAFIATVLAHAITASATVGGDKTINILGYEPVDSKVYLLKEFGDASESISLYYFNLKSAPSRAVEAKSLYAGYGDGVSAIGQMNNLNFYHQLRAIQKRLAPMQRIDNAQASVQIISVTTKSTTGGDCNFENCTQYRYQYRIQSGKYQSPIQTAISYAPSIKVTQTYKIPKHHMMVAVIRYTDTLWEGGYTTEVPVMLLPR